MLEQFLEFIHANIATAHWAIFGLLLLAGLNLPVSEDGMLFVSAVMASTYPEYKYKLFFGVYMGAYFSDVICYWLGRSVGPKLFNWKWSKKLVSRERVKKIGDYYEKYGIITLIFGRFIPFGARNALFLAAGISKMKFIKFALSDLVACTISSVLYFSLYYKFGHDVIATIKKANMAVAIFVVVAIIVFLFVKKRKERRAGPTQDIV